MECYLDLCIYNEDNQCTVKSISLDETGTCTDAIYLRIPKEEREKRKALQRDALDKDFYDSVNKK